MTKTTVKTIYEAAMVFNRNQLEAKLGKKIRAEQWRILQEICEERGLVSANGVIDNQTLETLATIKKNCGKFTSNRVVFNTYFDILSQLKTKATLYGFDIKNELKITCKKHNGFEPSDSTIYGWFNRSGLSFKSHSQYKLEEVTRVYIKCLFAKQPKRKSPNVDKAALLIK